MGSPSRQVQRPELDGEVTGVQAHQSPGSSLQGTLRAYSS